eukprot:CAMPEP_0184495044 /NCGR_PEP_ID=MMETSP0113_2-20130426/30235_1 /TAXON_ID=91329 /ORGANISM="Norrisiella sphaerica, Strain BC52" /LENGTH=93 /DNA_ID=CAMNT_0026881065 /DNA_START=195 /DNA_END=476 /DNA_ORIENTATION=-
MKNIRRSMSIPRMSPSPTQGQPSTLEDSNTLSSASSLCATFVKTGCFSPTVKGNGDCKTHNPTIEEFRHFKMWRVSSTLPNEVLTQTRLNGTA